MTEYCGPSASLCARTRPCLLRGLVLAISLFLASGAHAQDDNEDFFSSFGQAQKVEETDPLAKQKAGEGTVRGLVIDGETGLPVANVSVIIAVQPKGDGTKPRQEVARTGTDGVYDFPSLPPGVYDLSFVKSGYRTSAMRSFDVEAGVLNEADFPLPPIEAASSSDVMQLDAFVVEAAAVGDMLTGLELRMDADVQLNVMTAEDFSKYAAGDVADALRRVAGVNIVEGSFAVIRGLEDRYSSTLYNGAPIPSPDPVRQSVQLDLFPSEVLANLQVAKTFEASLPSNSSGGSVDIVTLEFPDEFTFQIKGAAEINENAWERFIAFEKGTPTGVSRDGANPLAGELGAMLGGTSKLWKREVRYKAVVNYETDYASAFGEKGNWQPARGVSRGRDPRPGDLAFGLLTLTDGVFEETISRYSDQITAYAAVGMDFDRDGEHKIDISGFYTKKRTEIVSLQENGFLPDFDYSPIVQDEIDGQSITFNQFSSRATLNSWIAGSGAFREFGDEPPSRGPAWFTNFNDSRSFEADRQMVVAQVNGEHDIPIGIDLDLTYAANFAKSEQDENVRGARYFLEPDDTSNIPTEFPSRADFLLPGDWGVNRRILLSENDVEELQGFGRLDLEYAHEFDDAPIELKVTTGGWFEYAKRDVSASFLQSPSVSGSSQFAIMRPSVEELGFGIWEDLDRSTDGRISGLRDSTNDSTRQIGAFNLGAKATFVEDIDVFASVRLESIQIDSVNRPFTGTTVYQAPSTYPPVYLFLDRLDNPARGEVLRPPPAGTSFNDQLLGIDVPVDPVTGFVDLLTFDQIVDYIDGEIDEFLVLPAIGATYRPVDGMAIRASYSHTVARPSFREMGYYVTVDRGTDDLVIGNPQLDLSLVRSVDGRIEYSWGGLGDLAAFSVFYKNIKDPIEAIVLRDPTNFSSSNSALFRTFYNNPNGAVLWGVEIEARKYMDFFGLDFLESISVGGNFTWIDAEVERSQAELDRVGDFYAVPAGVSAPYSGLPGTRRLFGQPQWIGNADLSFDHAAWGTRLTLAFYAISDVLDAAGSVTLQPNGSTLTYTPDRYIDQFHKLDLIVSQTIPLGFIRGDVTLKASAKNLTDSVRRVVYDTEITASTIAERAFTVGRTYKFEIKYAF